MRPKFAFLLLFIFVVSGLGGQATATNFSFEGMRRTRANFLQHYLERAIEREGQLTTDELRQRIVNLPTISRADYSYKKDAAGDSTLVFQIEESRGIYPILNLGGIKNNFFFQAGLNDINWRGRNQRLSFFYLNQDRQHNFNFYLQDPSWRDTRWGYYLSIRRYAAIEPLYFPTAAVNYRYVNTGLGLGISRLLKGRQSVEAGIDLFREDYQKQIDDPAIDTPGPLEVSQDKILLKLKYRLNRIDFGNQLTGVTNESNFQVVHNFADQTNFLIFWNDLRLFRPTGKRGTWAGRLRAGISTNNNSPFAPFVLDSQVNIRGSGNRIDRGTAQFVFNLEYRHAFLMDKRDRYFFQAVAFSDLGTWRNPGGPISEVFDRENFRHFVGGGLRLVLNQVSRAVLRIDYGVDIYDANQRGFVAGFGQYF